MYVASDGPRLYYVDSNQHIDEMGYHGSNGWANFDLMTQAGTASSTAPGTPLTMYLASDGPRVYFIDSNQHIDEIGYHNSSEWLNFDLMNQAGSGTVAEVGTPLTFYVASDGPRVYFVDTDQHIDEIGYHGSNGWVNFDLMSQAGINTTAASGTPLTMYTAWDGPRVYFVDTNQHIDEIGYHGSNGWANFDLMSQAGVSTTALAGTPLTSYLASDGPRMYFLDANQHIDEMGYHNSADWLNFDLMSQASTSIGAASGTPLIIYVASDGPRVYHRRIGNTTDDVCGIRWATPLLRRC